MLKKTFFEDEMVKDEQAKRTVIFDDMLIRIGFFYLGELATTCVNVYRGNDTRA